MCTIQKIIKMPIDKFEKEYLQNAANLVGLIIHEYFSEDKRRKSNKYFATYNGVSVSPVLDYSNLNHFIFGWIASQKYTLKTV